MTDDIKREVTENPDGSTTVSTSFTLDAESMRVVNDDVVEALDNALEALGTNLMHLIDPSRMVDFPAGGPAVWSIGMVEVDGDDPYTLLVTYGFSEVVAPAEYRQGLDYEFSIAVPAGQPVQPWAGALLRHLSGYVLRSGRPLEVGQIMPCHAPITRIPFPLDAHDGLPMTQLDAIVVAHDPVLPTLETSRGSIEIRRFLGVTPDERDCIETWSAAGFVEPFGEVGPRLLTDLERPSILADSAVAADCEVRAAAEGSDVPAFMSPVAWEIEGDDLILSFYDGATAAKVARGIRRRVGFGRTLLVMSPDGFQIGFEPSDSPTLSSEGPAVFIGATPDRAPLSGILEVLEATPDSEEPIHVAIAIG